MDERLKITVVGSGYVGMSLSVLLAQHNDVTVLDIDAERVGRINNKQSTVADTKIDMGERRVASRLAVRIEI